MSTLPSNYIKASAGRRFCASFINFISIGMLVILAGKIGSLLGNSDTPSTLTRIILIGFLIIFWLITACTKSPGSAFLMLERKTIDFTPLSLKRRLLRTIHFLGLGIVVYFPVQILPPQIREPHAIFIFVYGVVVVIDGISLMMRDSSFLDQYFKTSTIQLALPRQLMPTIFGRRLM